MKSISNNVPCRGCGLETDSLKLYKGRWTDQGLERWLWVGKSIEGPQVFGKGRCCRPTQPFVSIIFITMIIISIIVSERQHHSPDMIMRLLIVSFRRLWKMETSVGNYLSHLKTPLD